MECSESTTRLFIASSKLFSDFQMNISLYNISTIDDIITLFKDELSMVLKKKQFDQPYRYIEWNKIPYPFIYD